MIQLTGILLLVILVAGIFFIEESFPPVLLSRKANELRKLTGNWALHSKHQERDQSFKYWTRTYLLVPLEMLVDPICFLINLYASFIYAIIYLYVSPLLDIHKRLIDTIAPSLSSQSSSKVFEVGTLSSDPFPS